MKCKKCGFEIYDSDLYCGECGAKTSFNQKSKKAIYIIAILVIILLVIVIFCSSMNKDNSPLNDVSSTLSDGSTTIQNSSTPIELLCDWEYSSMGMFEHICSTDDYLIGKIKNSDNKICRISTKDGNISYLNSSNLTNDIDYYNQDYMVYSSVLDKKYYVYDINQNKELEIKVDMLETDNEIFLDNHMYYKKHLGLGDYKIYKYNFSTQESTKFIDCHEVSHIYADLLNENYIYITDIYSKFNEDTYASETTSIIKRYDLQNNTTLEIFDMGNYENIDEYNLIFVGGTMYILSINEDNTLYKVTNGKPTEVLKGYNVDSYYKYAQTSNAVYISVDKNTRIKLTENGQAKIFNTNGYDNASSFIYNNLWWKYSNGKAITAPYIYALSEKDINTEINKLEYNFTGDILSISNDGIMYLHGMFIQGNENNSPKEYDFFKLDVSKYSSEELEDDFESTSNQISQDTDTMDKNVNNSSSNIISSNNTNVEEFSPNSEMVYTKYSLLFDNGEISDNLYLEIERKNIYLYNKDSEMSYTGTYTSSNGYLVGTYTEVTYNNGGDTETETINDNFKFEILPNHKLKDILGYGQWCGQTFGQNFTYVVD